MTKTQVNQIKKKLLQVKTIFLFFIFLILHFFSKALKAGEIFGEISFLLNTPTTANVIANESTEVSILEKSKLRVMFMRNPSLSGKFYHYISKVMSLRIKPKEN